jgi:hypothetical protein
MLNRSAVIVRPQKPFCDWLRAVDYEDAPEVTLDEMGPTLYLVPDYEDSADAEKVLKKVCDEIFCRELEGWNTDVEVWPRGPEPEGLQALVRRPALRDRGGRWPWPHRE